MHQRRSTELAAIWKGKLIGGYMIQIVQTRDLLQLRWSKLPNSTHLSDESSVSERRSDIWESVEVAMFMYFWNNIITLNWHVEKGTKQKSSRVEVSVTHSVYAGMTTAVVQYMLYHSVYTITVI